MSKKNKLLKKIESLQKTAPDSNFIKFNKITQLGCMCLDDNGECCVKQARFKFHVFLDKTIYNDGNDWFLTYSCKKHLPEKYKGLIK